MANRYEYALIYVLIGITIHYTAMLLIPVELAAVIVAALVGLRVVLPTFRDYP